MFEEIKIKNTPVGELQSKIKETNNSKNPSEAPPNEKQISQDCSQSPKKKLDDLFGFLDEISPNPNPANENINFPSQTQSNSNPINQSINVQNETIVSSPNNKIKQ